jgi:D-serine deaminase-like pyridoxal phosphate-dependent protein
MKFRVHIKTHKTSEGTRLQLDPYQDGDEGRPRADRLIVSTVEEGWMLVNSGTLRDCNIKSVSGAT